MTNVDDVSNRLKKLEEIEKKITTAIKSAGLTLEELAKDKPIEKTMEKHTMTFMQSLDEIETEMSTQISSLTQVATSHQHEGSIYSSQKSVQLLDETMQYASQQVDEMMKISQSTAQQK